MLDHSTFWRTAARRMRRKINAAIWLDRAATPMVVSAAISAAAVLLARHYWPQATTPWLWVIATGPSVLAAILTYTIYRRDFISNMQSLIRLEHHHQLNSALSAAHEGIAPWPAAPIQRKDGLKWAWPRVLAPTALTISLVIAALFFPVDAPASATSFTQPASWKLVEGNLEYLIENKLVDRTSTEETQKAIEALRERPQGEWFDHSSIEAGDNLLQKHRGDISELEGRLRETSRALRDLAEARAGVQADGPDPSAAFNDLMEELKMGGLTPDPELLEKIAEMQKGGDNPLQQIDPRQLAELLDQIQGNAQKLSEMLEQMGGQAGQGEEDGQAGEGEGEQPGPGQGDIQRGPGQGGPLDGDPNDPANDKPKRTPLAAGDISRSLPGDYLGEGGAEHDIDPNVSPELRAGGQADKPGDGGGAVWRESLHPSEQQAIRRFFE